MSKSRPSRDKDESANGDPDTMNYVLLIHASEAAFHDPRHAVKHAALEQYGAFTAELAATGKLGDCAALSPIGTATTVRVRDGKRSVTDGPFAETREQLGGYYGVADMTEEEACAWAAKVPDAEGGSIEVRPLVELPPRPAGKGAPAPVPPPTEANTEYLLLIYEQEARWENLSAEETAALFARYRKVSDDLAASGLRIASEPLQPVAKARTVRVAKGKRTVTDGPFAETREQLGGYYRIRARNLDEAIAWAAKIPAAETGCIEVRPVMDTSHYV
jgi:hypothetical protein